MFNFNWTKYYYYCLFIADVIPNTDSLTTNQNKMALFSKPLNIYLASYNSIQVVGCIFTLLQVQRKGSVLWQRVSLPVKILNLLVLSRDINTLVVFRCVTFNLWIIPFQVERSDGYYDFSIVYDLGMYRFDSKSICH